MNQSTPFRNNVDDAEVAKFNALAARWWDPEGDFRPLHEINPLRLDWIRQSTQLAGRRIVDIGCGGGILTESMAEAGATVTGIDMADGPLTVARLHQVESGVAVDYLQTTAEELADQRPAEFDVVTCLEMLEHVPVPYDVIRSCRTLQQIHSSVGTGCVGSGRRAAAGLEHWTALQPLHAGVLSG
jgi:2-polyprenyl-6-hydroxyphenyl methylase/3-demethylubiquinone-9 3-methyltransferase